ncbi:unnamed protein product [Cyprideis torosa]|uniref:Uncharacterized protein n=1 Tax=Cyprideis torosa TaxID=163714 RepID=A0A7R8ZQR7_9CRUS|nr:unnamed protein product [Cyprideis torosa]CAG0902001.1 unnamed protein product [Cyprideis torosa]
MFRQILTLKIYSTSNPPHDFPSTASGTPILTKHKTPAQVSFHGTCEIVLLDFACYSYLNLVFKRLVQ